MDASFEGSDQQVTAMLRRKGPEAIKAMVFGVNTQAAKLQSHIVLDKLSGQVLNIRSGKLAGSIRIDPPATVTAESIFADVVGGGGPAWYGKIHEYGGVKSYIIEASHKKALMFRVGSKVIFAKRVNHPPLPMRSFMRSALDDLRENIANWFRITLARVFAK